MKTFFQLIALLVIAAHLRSLILLLVARTFGTSPRLVKGDASRGGATVLVQIPVYRDHQPLMGVARSITRLHYPRSRLRIQILDDSPQAERHASYAAAALLERHHIRATVISRSTRQGFKAGALNHGMTVSGDDFVVVLDCDFELHPDYLLWTLKPFKNPRVAAVQARYSFGCANSTSATLRVQDHIFSLLFDLEFPARRSLDVSVLFVGTAGVWRRSALDEIGGWRTSVFTAEDLDASYAAIRAGYSIEYVDLELARGQCAPSFLHYRLQQRRWARGVSTVIRTHSKGLLTTRMTASAAILEWTAFLPQASLLLTVPCLVGFCLTPFNGNYLLLLAAVLCLLPPALFLVNYRSRQVSLRLLLRRVGENVNVVALLPSLISCYYAGVIDHFFRSSAPFDVTPKAKAPQRQRRGAAFTLVAIDSAIFAVLVFASRTALAIGNPLAAVLAAAFCTSILLGSALTLRL